MPRSTAVVLRQAGYDAVDVRDVALRGRKDAEIFADAQGHSATLITADKGFANILSFPLGTHAGIVVLRVPNELSTQRVNGELLRALTELEPESLSGMLVIVETSRTRVRRARAR